jgi:HSP20 family protein
MRRPDADWQQLRERMNHLLENAQGEDDSTPLWAPVVDVSENKDEIVLQAELPGMKKEEIDIQLTGETLTISGERKLERTQRGEQFHRVERQYGRWQRQFQIEIPIDTEKVSASYQDGVLTVRLHKQEAVKPRHIEIEAK